MRRPAYRLWPAILVLAFVIGSVGPAPLFAQSFEPRTKDAPQQQERGAQQSTTQNSTANSTAGNAPDSNGSGAIKWFDYKVAELRALNKITGRTRTFSMAAGKSRQFGDIYVRLRACREPPPIEKRESAAFLQVWEQGKSGESKWIFSGWMFASSPALSSMDHPVYDVWLLDCIDKVGGKKEQKSGKQAQSGQNGEEAGDEQDTGAGRQTSPAVTGDDESVIERERLPAQ